MNRSTAFVFFLRDAAMPRRPRPHETGTEHMCIVPRNAAGVPPERPSRDAREDCTKLQPPPLATLMPPPATWCCPRSRRLLTHVHCLIRSIGEPTSPCNICDLVHTNASFPLECLSQVSAGRVILEHSSKRPPPPSLRRIQAGLSNRRTPRPLELPTRCTPADSLTITRPCVL